MHLTLRVSVCRIAHYSVLCVVCGGVGVGVLYRWLRMRDVCGWGFLLHSMSGRTHRYTPYVPHIYVNTFKYNL